MIAFMGNLCPIASENNIGLIPLFELLLVLIVQLVLIVGVVGAGLSISPSVLHDLINKRETFLFLTFLQTLFIPLMGVATVVILQPTIDVQRAILIIAACPAGGISSLYVLLRVRTQLFRWP
jgi:predicted Na+-dependent transporter